MGSGPWNQSQINWYQIGNKKLSKAGKLCLEKGYLVNLRAH